MDVIGLQVSYFIFQTNFGTHSKITLKHLVHNSQAMAQQA